MKPIFRSCLEPLRRLTARAATSRAGLPRTRRSIGCGLRNAALFCLLAFGAAACDKATEARFGRDDALSSIAYFKTLCRGASTTLRQDILIRGRVTGNDRFGEFDRQILIEDASGGIAIAIDRAELADLYPIGIEVTVLCNGLTLMDYGGKVVLGTEPDERGIGRIPGDELLRYLRTAIPDDARPAPARLRFREVGLQHTDTYVQFDDVRFPDGGTWCATDPETHRSLTTEHRITDAAGDEFIVRVAHSCAYAKKPVPEGTGSLCGIIDYFNGKFSLRVTNHETEFVNVGALPTAYPSDAGY